MEHLKRMIEESESKRKNDAQRFKDVDSDLCICNLDRHLVRWVRCGGPPLSGESGAVLDHELGRLDLLCPDLRSACS